MIIFSSLREHILPTLLHSLRHLVCYCSNPWPFTLARCGIGNLGRRVHLRTPPRSHYGGCLCYDLSFDEPPPCSCPTTRFAISVDTQVHWVYDRHTAVNCLDISPSTHSIDASTGMFMLDHLFRTTALAILSLMRPLVVQQICPAPTPVRFFYLVPFKYIVYFHSILLV